MENIHFPKVFSYMYYLIHRNIRAYNKPIKTPKSDIININSIHWVGHGTTVINLNGKNIITDPVAGNLGFIKRLIKPSINFKTIRADYILLTHFHMDHLNYKTLFKMNKDAIVITPKGIKIFLKLIGFKNIVEIKEEESYEDGFINVKCYRAKHVGNRYPFIGNKECHSYLVSYGEKSVFIAGDTANTTKYKGIKADAAIMPVGCYKPDEYLKMHCSPEQSFKMFDMMNCKVMIPIHYRTYFLAQDKDSETIATLKKINDGRIKIIEVGNTVPLS